MCHAHPIVQTDQRNEESTPSVSIETTAGITGQSHSVLILLNSSHTLQLYQKRHREFII